jgi:hypothetical protein
MVLCGPSIKPSEFSLVCLNSEKFVRNCQENTGGNSVGEVIADLPCCMGPRAEAMQKALDPQRRSKEIPSPAPTVNLSRTSLPPRKGSPRLMKFAQTEINLPGGGNDKAPSFLKRLSVREAPLARPVGR